MLYIIMVFTTIIGGVVMFTIAYSDFVDCSLYTDFSVSYMPGLKVDHMKSAKILLNIDSKTAFVYWE